MIFDYKGGSSVTLAWGEEDHNVVKSFLKSNFPFVHTLGNSCELSYAKFILNFDNFAILDLKLINKSIFSDSLQELIQNVSNYNDEISNQSAPSEEEIKKILKEKGFKRDLFWYQLRNVQNMVSISASANFSVPGAGKTTDALATYLFNRTSVNDKVLIICPKSAFLAWEEDIAECLENEKITHLGNARDTELGLKSESNFKILNYERYRDDSVVRNLINEDVLNPTNNYTVILDESHRMKGPKTYQAISELAVARKKIILTGTPMPQSHQTDLKPQFLFLYPNERNKIVDPLLLDQKFQPIYRRTTKSEMGLPEPKIILNKLKMKGAQAELNQTMISELINFDIGLKQTEQLKALKGIIFRYIQFCSNPHLQLGYINGVNPSLGAKIFKEGYGAKFDQIVEDAEELALSGEKVIIWSTFPRNLEIIANKLAFFNPVQVHGSIPVGADEKEIDSRRFAIWQFKNNPDCKIFLANPMTAGEGISLHKICSNALYLDRTYNAAHYLQSKDRIHRLGIAEDAEINIHLYLLEDSIDFHIHDRLNYKTKQMAKFLNDSSILQNEFELDITEFDEVDENAHIPDFDIKSLLNFFKK